MYVQTCEVYILITLEFKIKKVHYPIPRLSLYYMVYFNVNFEGSKHLKKITIVDSEIIAILSF